MADLFYNPDCSKCRTAESLLGERGVDLRHVRYLDRSPTRAELVTLMAQLGIEDPRLMMRTGEDVYAELGLAQAPADELLDAITRHPVLLERPILVVGGRAVIARPPERVFELLNPVPSPSGPGEGGRGEPGPGEGGRGEPGPGEGGRAESGPAEVGRGAGRPA